MTLYHYTCHHARQRIGRRGMLIPTAQPALGNRRLVWLTNQTDPQREALGLTSHILDCDRLSFRYLVDVTARDIQPWDLWKREAGLSHAHVMLLEAAPGAEPSLWFVSERSLLGVLDRTYGLERKAS